MLFQKIAIVGVGLIGGSLGAALRARAAVGEVLGIGYRASTLEEARRRGCIDGFATSIDENIADAELIVIATPVSLIAEKAREIAECCSPDCIITDVGSTKRLIVERLDAIFADNGRFVGSHPMAGSEKRGAAYSDEQLFENALCILTQTQQTDPAALDRLEQMWRAVGTRTCVMPPDEHDHRVALASHIPHLAAAGLVNIQNDDSLYCAASGFSDATRIAASDPKLWCDICFDNDREVIAGLEQLIQRLTAARNAVAAGDREALTEYLRQASERRRAWGENRLG